MALWLPTLSLDGIIAPAKIHTIGKIAGSAWVFWGENCRALYRTFPALIWPAAHLPSPLPRRQNSRTACEICPGRRQWFPIFIWAIVALCHFSCQILPAPFFTPLPPSSPDHHHNLTLTFATTATQLSRTNIVSTSRHVRLLLLSSRHFRTPRPRPFQYHPNLTNLLLEYSRYSISSIIIFDFNLLFNYRILVSQPTPSQLELSP